MGHWLPMLWKGKNIVVWFKFEVLLKGLVFLKEKTFGLSNYRFVCGLQDLGVHKIWSKNRQFQKAQQSLIFKIKIYSSRQKILKKKFFSLLEHTFLQMYGTHIIIS